jgi:hypothetical protein
MGRGAFSVEVWAVRCASDVINSFSALQNMMHDQHVDEAANSLRRIIAALRAEHPASAYGGLWALAGFSLQAGVFLLHFFRNLIANRSLPSIEELSDILCPAEGQITLVMQVKRTLTRATLAKALKEFALIIRLIQSHNETAVLESLRFQVACGKREANVEWPWPADAALQDDIRNMLGEMESHQADPFIVEQVDPLEDLWALLWSQGVCDPQAIIREAAGRLLESFGRPNLAVHRDLISYFANAPRRTEGPRTGYLVLAEDVVPEANAESSHKIVVGGGFGFRELRQGCFRHRPLIFADLWTNFAQWLSEMEFRILEREIPVFWIDGRSGEGKSVLLRQLVAHLLLRHPDRLPVVEVSREELPQAVKERREVLDHPALLIVDDLYAVSNREEWDERLSQAVETDLAPLFILTCGPSEQREEFERRFSEPFRMTRFNVPPFGESERQQFVDWYINRTGKQPGQKTLTTENALLVQLIFELSEGTTLNEFARRFRKRLELGGVLSAVQLILALSALYLETPLGLLAQTDERDVISRLSQDDQRHFRLDEESVNFAHAHLAGEILRPILEKSHSKISWEIAWARELSAVLAVPKDRLPVYIQGNIVGRLTRTPRLRVAERARALKELYESQVASNQGAPAGYLLPYWLSALIALPDISLNPSPIDYACSAIGSPEVSVQFPPQVVISLWQLKDRTRLTSEELSQACWDFLLRTANRYPNSPAIVDQFLRVSSPRYVYCQRAIEWLDNNPQHQQAYRLLASLVTAAPNDVEVRDRALLWLENNSEHQKAYHVLASLVAAAPNDAEVRDRALLWLKNNSEHQKAYHVLAPLVAAAPDDAEIRGRALLWLKNNSEHQQAYHVLAPLVAAAPNDAEIRSRALLWLENNSEHQQAYQLLAPLVAAAPDDAEIRDRALLWLEKNFEHSQAYWLLSPLVAAAPADAEIRGRALLWLKNNSEHQQAYQLLAPLVAAAPNDAEIRGRALKWLDNNAEHPQISHLLTPVIARCPDDQAEEWIRKGMDYIRVPERKGCASVLAATLVRSKARHDIIDYALGLAASVLKNRRGFILHNLARACTYNPSSALSYISSCSDQQRRRQVTLAIAKGILKYEARLPDLVSALETQPSRIIFEVLGQCLRVGISTPEFLAYVVQALNRGFRRPGYGTFLRRFIDYPAVWNSIEPELSSIIKEDFRRASSRNMFKEP